jgi:tripartite-type tricarboxylate transporter receptor subunit TctC
MHAAISRIARCALLFGLAAISNAQAQDYPDRPIRIVVNTAVGGTVDITGRVLAQHLTEVFGKPVIIENRDGGGGVIGASAVAKAPPDGYTLLYCSAGITSFAALQKNLPFNPATDLVPVVPVVSLPFLFVTPPGSPYKTLAEYLAQAKKAPGTLTIASGGTGTFGHLLGAWLKAEAGVDLIHVPYRGAGPALQALLGGQVALYPDPIATSAPLVKSGKIRALAISSSRRSSLLPDTPTLIESGYPVQGVTWFGILVPAAVPKDIVRRLNEAVNKLLPKLRPTWEASGYFMEGGSVADFGKRFTAESATWAKLIAEAGITVEN